MSVHSMVFILFRTSRARDYDTTPAARKTDVEQLAYLGHGQEPRAAHGAGGRRPDPAAAPDFAHARISAAPRSEQLQVVGVAAAGTTRRIHGYSAPATWKPRRSGITCSSTATWRTPDPGCSTTERHGRRSRPSTGRAGACSRVPRIRARRPPRARPPAHLQSIVVIQPIDFLPDGPPTCADGCPDMTVHNGQLVWSCRSTRAQGARLLAAGVPAARS
jgi:hypothetical protein